MSNRLFKFIQVSLVACAAIVGLPSCTDDHFDVRDDGGAGSNATLTLWQQIESRPELSYYATLASKIPYFKDEKHPVKGYTYKDILSGTQTLTAFIPTNDAIGQEEYDRLLAMCDTDPYLVYLSFVGNHLAKYRYTVAASAKDEKLVLVNGKKAVFNGAEKTFKGVEITQANIPATNGYLHILKEEAPFAYNIYEYIKAAGDDYSEIRTWITSHDTIFFSESLSAEGAPDENGNPTYVDSIYSRTNILWQHNYSKSDGTEWLFPLKGFSASLESEDSVYAMVLPNNTAWKNAYDELKNLYNYCETYPNKYLEDNGNRDPEALTDNPDSLQDLSIKMDLASTLLFNCRLQLRTPENPGFWTAETFNDTPMPKIFNTRTDTFIVDKDLVGDAKELLFAGAQPQTVSNGLVYPVSEWNFLKAEGARDVEMKISYNYFFNQSNLGTTTTSRVTFTNSNSAFVNDSLFGKVSDDYIFYISAGNTSPSLPLKVVDNQANHQIYSNQNYGIYLVMVPDFYRYSTDSIYDPQQAGVTPENFVFKQNKIDVKVSYHEGNVTSKGVVKEKTQTFKGILYGGHTVDTVFVGNITFPYSYKNLSKSYPTITLSSGAKSSDIKSGNFQHAFSIDRVIFKAEEPSNVK